ncbi:MAG: hypothetical protein V4638_07740 [Bacteroidota bacterium]
MKRLFLLLLFSTFISVAEAQTYGYSFEGNLDAASEISLFEKISHLEAVLGVKFILKAEQSVGEVIIIVDPMINRGENDHPFSPKIIKTLYLEYGLTPINFRKIQ